MTIKLGVSRHGIQPGILSSGPVSSGPRARTGQGRVLGGVVFSALACLALAACSGSDGGDDPIAENETPGDTAQTPPRGQGDGDGTVTTPGVTNEGNPAVTGRDDGEDTQAGSEDEESEAGGMSTSPVATAIEVPDTEHCAAVADWDPEWVQFEEEVLLLVNEFRSQPADCGVEGQFAAAPPLAMDPTLRCSARLHSLDMFERDFFDHDNPDGLDPFQRMQEAGFEGQRMGENIAAGQRTPEEVMDAWMESDGHCSNIMLPQYTLIGIGFDPGGEQTRGSLNNYWTQNFGTPFEQRRSR